MIAASLLELFADDVDAHVAGTAPAHRSQLISELVAIDDGVAHVDERHREKQPDWTYDATDSGKTPAARLGEHREPEPLDE